MGYSVMNDICLEFLSVDAHEILLSPTSKTSSKTDEKQSQQPVFIKEQAATHAFFKEGKTTRQSDSIYIKRL